MLSTCTVSCAPTFKAVPLDSFSLWVSPNYLPHVSDYFKEHYWRRSSVTWAWVFLCVKCTYSHIVHCFQRSVRKLEECDISFKVESKSKNYMKGETRGDSPPGTFAEILVKQGDTILTPVESETLWVCTTSWLCEPLSEWLSLFVHLFTHA